MLKAENTFPIAVGTFNIDLENKEKSLESLLYSYEQGQNYIDTSILYEGGKVAEFLASFFNKINRDKVFVTTTVTYTIEKASDVAEQLDRALGLMNLEYVDCILLHSPTATKISLDDTFNEMQKLVNQGKARYLGLSNATLSQVKEVHEKYKLSVFEALYNLECKTNEDLEIIKYCKDNDIEVMCYQPLRRNRTAKRNYPLLVELAEKYSKTQNQIILNWLLNEKKLRPVIKSTNIDNINKNLESLDFVITQEDIKKLNSFRSKEFDSVEIDWEGKGGIEIHKLPNQFE